MNILEQIAAKKRERVAALKKKWPLDGYIPRNLLARSFPHNGPFIIAECKKASPSRGIITPYYDPAAMARSYSDGGASAVSVLTEEDYFLGSVADLAAVRNSVPLTILRKDFILESWQVRETVLTGADAMLLIVSLLDRVLLKELFDEAVEHRLTVLVEAHDEHEIERALSCGAQFIGINARNLRDFTISTDEAARLAQYIPADSTAVAESGITSVESLLKLKAAGYKGFLIGEHFMCAGDPAAAVRQFRDALKESS
ncbi:MAG TPA: indole-3-glycerol phosphate synthase TrpC [Spirochaetota bacterium]|nr:indole-3-glycerol phosphate synthase TrpC [Spirochaetota bacterium]